MKLNYGLLVDTCVQSLTFIFAIEVKSRLGELGQVWGVILGAILRFAEYLVSS